MKIIALVGSSRKKHTYQAVEAFFAKLTNLIPSETEIVSLSDYDIRTCKGCILCTDKGEEFCPLKDDRDRLLEKMDRADAVVFATPNYAFHLSGLMKVFLDRTAFVFHRPRFFGKICTSLVVQGVYGGGKIVKYLDFIGEPFGFNVVKGSCLMTLEPISERTRRRNDVILTKHVRRFAARLGKKPFPPPHIFKVLMFRISRSRIRVVLDEKFRDFVHFRDMGWFMSPYYYPVRLGPGKRLLGAWADRWASGSAARDQKS